MVGGRLRGRGLKAPKGSTTRPTTDRVREALFDLLGDIREARVLDLYAGSGALGIEAWSRGGSRVVFVDSARRATECIQENLQELGIGTEATVVRARAEAAAARLAPLGPFDLVLCDPPWADLARCCAALPPLLRLLLAQDATIVVEHRSREEIPHLNPIAGPPFDRRSYGDTGLSLFQASPALSI